MESQSVDTVEFRYGQRQQWNKGAVGWRKRGLSSMPRPLTSASAWWSWRASRRGAGCLTWPRARVSRHSRRRLWPEPRARSWPPTSLPRCWPTAANARRRPASRTSSRRVRGGLGAQARRRRRHLRPCRQQRLLLRGHLVEREPNAPRGGRSVRIREKGSARGACDCARCYAPCQRKSMRPFEMRGHEMKGWLRVDAESVSTKRALEPWVGESVAFARALPPKEKN